MEERRYTTEKNDLMRIDKFLSEKLPDLSRSYLQKLIKEKEVLVNGQPVKANYKLSLEDHISVMIPELKEPDILPEQIPLDILYEDEDILVVNKPKGMVVHPSAGHYSGTLVNALMFHCKDQLSGINGVMRPGIVHRIDMDTTGSLIVCKNDFAHQSLAEQLKDHTITRKYHAIVHGVLKEDNGTIDAPIGRHPVERKKMSVNYKNGKHAVTHYRVLKRFGDGKNTPDSGTHGKYSSSSSWRCYLWSGKISNEASRADTSCKNSRHYPPTYQSVYGI